MFLDFYKMKEQPFGVTPDPRFLYLGKSHREALASLYYGIESDRGFVALIAQPGLGKTTLTFQLLEKLQKCSRTVFLFQTKCNSRDLFHYLLNGLGVDTEGMELVSMHNKLNQILSYEMLAGRRFVLAIDEAQNLDPEVLETIRLLSNFETSQAKLLQIVLIGQPQLARKLASPELEQLRQRISVFARIEPFGSEETSRYIAHRLEVAGYEGGPLFAPGALRMIAEHSQGIPRKINALCFSALSLRCATDRKQVDVAIMEEVIADGGVESLEQSRVARRLVSSPVVGRPSVITYPVKPRRSLGRWAIGVASVAACVAIGIGVLTLSPSRVDRSIQVSSEAWASIRNSAASIRSLIVAKSRSVPFSSTLNVQAAELPKAHDDQLIPTSEGEGTRAVIVQRGDTFRQIVLRIVGTYNGETIEEIRKLNPGIADFNQLEVGQTILLPRVSVPANSAVSGDGAGAIVKN
jgi:type II secretory pathway predicted ATPase ExeA